MPLVILSVLVIALVAVFSVQNAVQVSVTFLSWNFEASLAIIIFLSFLAGAVLAAALMSLQRFSRRGEKEKPGQA